MRYCRDLPKRPTSLSLTKDGQTILVSDKFGDVFRWAKHTTCPQVTSQQSSSYPLHPDPSTEGQTPAKRSRDSLSAHENPSGGTLVLGHVSLLTNFILTPDERYIVTADRDEHVRVSWYPQGYNIEMFCLGHRKYVMFRRVVVCAGYAQVRLMAQVCFRASRSSFRSLVPRFWWRRPGIEGVGLDDG